eukprot:SAG11_NODE_4819_length_1754_cov_4.054985_1_plen_224_part_00
MRTDSSTANTGSTNTIYDILKNANLLGSNCTVSSQPGGTVVQPGSTVPHGTVTQPGSTVLQDTAVQPRGTVSLAKKPIQPDSTTGLRIDTPSNSNPLGVQPGSTVSHDTMIQPDSTMSHDTVVQLGSTATQNAAVQPGGTLSPSTKPLGNCNLLSIQSDSTVTPATQPSRHTTHQNPVEHSRNTGIEPGRTGSAGFTWGNHTFEGFDTPSDTNTTTAVLLMQS